MKKQVTCYISKSLMYHDNVTIKNIIRYFSEYNIKVTMYDPTTNYTDKDLINADFVLFLPLKTPYIYENQFQFACGKGQFDEVNKALIHKKLSFAFHSFDDKNDLTVTSISTTPKYNDINNWTKNYGVILTNDWLINFGTVISHSINNKTISILSLLKEKIYDSENNSEIVINKKLLLL